MGAQLGEALTEPLVIALSGPLGAGKTCFVQGLVKGLQATDGATSPTFTLLQEYPGGRIPVAHLDFYRLKSAREVLNLGFEDYLGDCVVVVEWAELFPEILPPTYLGVQFDLLDETKRRIHFRESKVR